MAYSDFKTIDQIVETLGVQVTDIAHLFADISPVPVAPFLQQQLDECLDLATSISTEKARSELVITPILLEVRRLVKFQMGFFSGTTFNIAADKGLMGACDFLLTATPNQAIVTAPVVTIVEAKDDNLRAGLAQCIAQVVAAQMLNQKYQEPAPFVLGAVSTGTNWRFMKLESDVVVIDRTEYLITQLDQILGILLSPFAGVGEA
jgi:hypothetical protein